MKVQLKELPMAVVEIKVIRQIFVSMQENLNIINL